MNQYIVSPFPETFVPEEAHPKPGSGGTSAVPTVVLLSGERLTKDTHTRYAVTRARVEARATLEQAEELREALEELGERLGE